MDRSKLGQLIRGRWAGRLPDDNTNQVSENIEKLDVALESDVYQPPGEFFAPNESVSRLIVPAVEIDPWSIFWLVLVAVTGGIGLLSYIVLTAVPPSPDCKQVVLLSTDSERLYCTKLAVETNDRKEVIAAINLVKGWSERNPLYNDGKSLLNKWSQELLEITRQELVVGGDLLQAIDSLNTIPPQSTVYEEAQKDIAQWKIQWQEGKKIDDKFWKAIQTADWEAGHESLNKVRTIHNTYWQTTRYNQMAIQFAQEKDGWESFQAAESIARGEDADVDRRSRSSTQKNTLPVLVGEDEAVFYVLDPNVLAKAIELASKVTSGSYFKEKASARRELWSQAMLTIATEKLRVRKYAAAIAAAQQIPRGVKAYAAAQNVAVEAEQAVAQNNGGEASPESIDNHIILTKALQAGRIGSLSSLSEAVAIASQIPADRPFWTEAQAFIKYWNQQMQFINDQPLLEKARAFAKRGALAPAIKTAGKLNRISYPVIQNEVEQWQQTLAMLTIRRDRPVLERAQSLYGQGRLAAAIAAASQIPQDSPVYADAQILLKSWQSTSPKAQ